MLLTSKTLQQSPYTPWQDTNAPEKRDWLIVTPNNPSNCLKSVRITFLLYNILPLLEGTLVATTSQLLNCYTLYLYLHSVTGVVPMTKLLCHKYFWMIEMGVHFHETLTSLRPLSTSNYLLMPHQKHVIAIWFCPRSILSQFLHIQRLKTSSLMMSKLVFMDTILINS